MLVRYVHCKVRKMETTRGEMDALEAERDDHSDQRNDQAKDGARQYLGRAAYINTYFTMPLTRSSICLFLIQINSSSRLLASLASIFASHPKSLIMRRTFKTTSS